MICHVTTLHIHSVGAARKGVVPSELGYGYFCGNVVSEDNAWVSSFCQSFNYPLYLSLITRDMSLSAAYKTM
jgi:hypothetical protein